MPDSEWFAVRCVFAVQKVAYEERITLWRAGSHEEAIELALAEADGYVQNLEMENLGLAQSYRLFDDPSESGAEVFSLIRDSELPPDEYLSRFFNTGDEYQRSV